MMPGSYPLSIYHGDSYHWQFKLWSDEGKTQPLDLTGVTAEAEIRDKPGGASIFAMDCQVVLPNIVEVVLSATMCATLPIANMAWDLQLTYSTGEVNTILAGTVAVTQDVTDAVVPTGTVTVEGGLTTRVRRA